MKIEYPTNVDPYQLPLPLADRNSTSDQDTVTQLDLIYSLIQLEKKVGVNGPWDILEEGTVPGAETWIPESHEYRLAQIEATGILTLQPIEIGTPNLGEIIWWDGSRWTNRSPVAWLNLTDLLDVTITSPAVRQVLRYSGTEWVNALVKLNDIDTPDADSTLSMANKKWKLSFTNPGPSGSYDGAWEIEGIGAWTGDLVHIHQHTGAVAAGADLVHLEGTDTDCLPLHVIAGGDVAIQTTKSIEIAETAAPATPGTGYGRLYVKTDGKIYFLNDAGTETDLTLGGGGAPAGSNTEIQYNNSGSFGASANLTWTDGSKTLGLGATSTILFAFVNGGTTNYIKVADAGGSQDGNPLTIVSGKASQATTGANGGPLVLLGGQGDVDGTGGYVNIIGGDAYNGGDVYVTPGDGVGGTDGTLYLGRTQAGANVGTVSVGGLATGGYLLSVNGSIISKLNGGSITLDTTSTAQTNTLAFQENGGNKFRIHRASNEWFFQRYDGAAWQYVFHQQLTTSTLRIGSSTVGGNEPTNIEGNLFINGNLRLDAANSDRTVYVEARTGFAAGRNLNVYAGGGGITNPYNGGNTNVCGGYGTNGGANGQTTIGYTPYLGNVGIRRANAGTANTEFAGTIYQAHSGTQAVMVIERTDAGGMSVDLKAPDTQFASHRYYSGTDNWQIGIVSSDYFNFTFNTSGKAGLSSTGQLVLGVSTGATQQLDVRGNAILVGTTGFDAAGETATLYLGDTNNYIQAKYGTGLELRVPTNSWFPWLIQTTEVMRLSTAGKLSIGSTISNPNQWIHVTGATSYGQIQIEAAAATGEASISFKGNAETDSTAAWVVGKYVGSSTDLRFFINSTTPMALTTTGQLNLGIGNTITSDPATTPANNIGWKIGLYSTSYAIGIASSTLYLKTGSLVSFGSSNPANSGSPDSNAKFTIDGVNGGWYSDGKCYEYNNITTEGWGLPSIHDYATSRRRTSSVGIATSNTTPTGFYRISMYVEVQEIDSGVNSATMDVNWRDFGGTTRSESTASISSSSGIGTYSRLDLVVQHTGAGATGITIDCNVIGGDLDYFDFYWTIERLN